MANFEYLILRLIRRFLFPQFLLKKLAHRLPYYQISIGESQFETIVQFYQKYLRALKLEWTGKRVLEVGAGATQATAYSLMDLGAQRVIVYEPYEKLNRILDQKIQSQFKSSYSNVKRISDLSELPNESVDLILSHSVLEHVSELSALMVELKRVLTPQGWMIHVVDYRDHFFKYPYHFLKYSKFVWDHFLNPGDLTRLRISQHIEKIRSLGLSCQILDKTSDSLEWEKIKNQIHQEFDSIHREDLAITQAVIAIQKN